MSLRTDPVLDFGKFSGRRVSQLPQFYLAWIIGYSRIGSTDITLPREQSTSPDFRHTKPGVYFAALNELVERNRCLVCDKTLVGFKSTKDWWTRLLHKKCYNEHLEGVYEQIADDDC